MTLRTLHESYSLAWLEMSTITLLTLIGSLCTLLSFIKNHTQSSRSRLETVCDSINTASEQIANTPYLLLQTSMNSIDTAKNNIHQNLSTAVFVVENIIVWLIRMYKSTYRCLLELAVRSVLSLVTQIAGPVQTVAQGVTSILNLGSDNNGSTTTLHWTESLTNIQRRIDDWLKNEDDMIRSWIDPPFQTMQMQLNNSFSTWQAPSNSHISAMRIQNNTTVAATATSSQLLIPCQPQPLLEALNNAEAQLLRLIHILIGVLLALFLICVLVNLLFIRFRHDRVTQARRLFLLRPHYNTDNSSSNTSNDRIDKGRMQEEQEHLDKLLWTFSTKLSWRKRGNILHRLLCFMAHPIILYCLVVGLSGVILIHCLASVVETKASEISQDMVRHTQAWTTNTTSDYMLTSQTQIEDINQWLNSTEMSLNDHVFGVIKSSALAINDTLTTVVHHVHGFIEDTLGGTLLETPAKDLTHCLLLTKIDNLQNGLTWLASHSYVHLSRVNDVDNLTKFQSKLQDSISKHINFLLSDYGGSFLTQQFESMASFYYMLLMLWTICLCIGIAFQVKYYFYGGRPPIFPVIEKSLHTPEGKQ